MAEVSRWRRTIGDVHIERVRVMASRRQGVSVPEVREALGVGRWAVMRFMHRLVNEGIIRRTGETRRRLEVYGTGSPGAPVVVYRARR